MPEATIDENGWFVCGECTWTPNVDMLIIDSPHNDISLAGKYITYQQIFTPYCTPGTWHRLMTKLTLTRYKRLPTVCFTRASLTRYWISAY